MSEHVGDEPPRKLQDLLAAGLIAAAIIRGGQERLLAELEGRQQRLFVVPLFVVCNASGNGGMRSLVSSIRQVPRLRPKNDSKIETSKKRKPGTTPSLTNLIFVKDSTRQEVDEWPSRQVKGGLVMRVLRSVSAQVWWVHTTALLTIQELQGIPEALQDFGRQSEMVGAPVVMVCAVAVPLRDYTWRHEEAREEKGGEGKGSKKREGGANQYIQCKD